MTWLLTPRGRLIIIAVARSRLSDLSRDAAAATVSLGVQILETTHRHRHNDESTAVCTRSAEEAAK